jgi:hypothetical protein
MPRAKTGCSTILYTSITPEASKLLTQQVKEAGVSRPLYVDAMIKAQAERGVLKVEKPAYKPHKKVIRRSPGLV